MSDTQFFIRGRNRGNERKVILSSATLLVGKAPTKTKRVKMKIRMPLTGGKVAGTPEWVANAATFVSQSHDIVTPQVEFSGFDIAFSDESLFADAKAKATKCQMRNFVVCETGDSENPDVELQFTVYAPFSDRLWRWNGQMGGEEFWAQFVQVAESEAEGEFELGADDEEAEESEETEPAEA